MSLKPCPACGGDTAKHRLGSLGEIKGVWCTACGHSLTEAEWDQAMRSDPNHQWGSPMISDMSYNPPTISSARKLFNNRSHGKLINACPGCDLLPLINLNEIPDRSLSMVLDYVFGEIWTDHTHPQVMRDRIRELLREVT